MLLYLISWQVIGQHVTLTWEGLKWWNVIAEKATEHVFQGLIPVSLYNQSILVNSFISFYTKSTWLYLKTEFISFLDDSVVARGCSTRGLVLGAHTECENYVFTKTSSSIVQQYEISAKFCYCNSYLCNSILWLT